MSTLAKFLTPLVQNTLSDVVSDAGQQLFSRFLNRGDVAAANEYNLPKNQYRRLLDAGMSPASAMQAVAGSSGNVGSVATASSAGTRSKSLAEYRMIEEQLQMQREKNDAEIDLLKSQAEKNRNEVQSEQQLRPYQIKQLESAINHAASQTELNKVQKAQVEFLTEQAKKLSPFELEEANSRMVYAQKKVDEITQQVNYLKKQGDFVNEQILALKYRNELANIKSIIARTFHIDPSAPPLTQLIQSVLSGDGKGLSVFFDGIKNYYKGFTGSFDPDFLSNPAQYILKNNDFTGWMYQD